jgi:hypothetical protein
VDPSRDEDDFEKLMCLVNETHESPVRPSSSGSSSGGHVKSLVDQFEEWLLEKPIPYISDDNSNQEDIFHYCHDHLSGQPHVNQTYPD